MESDSEKILKFEVTLIKNMSGENYLRRHPIQTNILIILAVACIGLIIVYLSLGIFTRHGASATVPAVENMSYTQAIKILHENGFRTDIRDSVYNEDVEPGFVIEQFPAAGSSVKPGRKIFLYINAVQPREAIIDSEAGDEPALKGFSMRQGMAKLEELGFRNVNVVKVPGDNDRIIRLLVYGRPIKKMEKVPVNAMITMEVYDGRTYHLTDSIQGEEYLQTLNGEGEENIDEDDLLYDADPVIVE